MPSEQTTMSFLVLLCFCSIASTRTLLRDVDDTSSVKLKEIPHRIYLAGNEVLDNFDQSTLLKKPSQENVKFTYELVKPTACELLKPTFGCCWDNRTIAMGVHGEGCPECLDKKRSCKKWTDQCHIAAVREICPESCNVCPKRCHDTANCKLYARFGLCKSHLIRSFCKNSCGACMTNDSGESTG